MSLVWQIRHTAVHNVGVITKSDRIRLQLLAREAVLAPRILAPTRRDLTYLKRFLDETAEVCNRRIGERLGELLTVIHADRPTQVDPLKIANQVAGIFRRVVQVAGVHGIMPQD